MFSRFLYFRELGYEVIIIGKSVIGKSCVIRTDYSDILLLDEKRSGIQKLEDINHFLDKPFNIELVIARDLPSAKQALLLGQLYSCPVYYDSIETWTGYSVSYGRKKLFSFYRTWLSERSKISEFTRIITHSRTACGYLKNLYKLVPEKIGVLYSALPRSNLSFRPEVNSRHLANNSEKKLIVCSGGLTEGRGLVELIQIFRYVGQNLNLTFIGDGPLKPVLLNLVQQYGLDNQISFSQYSSVNEYYDRLRVADIGIDLRPPTHLNYDLACSVRVVDYINCSLPVITSDTQGFKFIENEYGIVKCIPNQLDTQSKGKQLEKFVDEYLGNLNKARQYIDAAMAKEFSFDANLARLKNWLLQDGVH